MIFEAGYIAPVPDAKNGFPEKCSKSGYLEQKIGKIRSFYLKSVLKSLLQNIFQELTSHTVIAADHCSVYGCIEFGNQISNIKRHFSGVMSEQDIQVRD